jgi:hypothetical protein
MAQQTQREQFVAAWKESGLRTHTVAGPSKRKFAVVTFPEWGTVTLDDRGQVYSAERLDGKKWSLDRAKEPLRSELRREILDSIILTGKEVRASKGRYLDVRPGDTVHILEPVN